MRLSVTNVWTSRTISDKNIIVKIHLYCAKTKAKLFFFDFVAAQFEHNSEFSMKPSGNEVAFPVINQPLH